MSAPKPNPAVRLMPSLTDVAFVLPLVFLFVRLSGVKYVLGDGDTGWHIRTGDWILQNGRVPDRDMFSFTKPGEPWFAWEWLWDVVFAWMHQRWGMEAVALASLFVICLTSALLYRLARWKSGNAVLAIAFTALAMAGSTIHWLARPHLFTLLFVVIFYSVLERANDGRKRLLWILPPLTALWSNIHAGFFVGVVLALTYGAGELAGAALDTGAESRRAAVRRSRPFFFCAAGCVLASFVNPYTYHLHIHIVRFLGDAYAHKNIVEYWPLSFHHPAARYFEAMLLAGVVAAAWSLFHRRFAPVLLVVVWAHLSLTTARNVPIFLILAAPLAAFVTDALMSDLAKANIPDWLRRQVAGFIAMCREICATDRIGRVYAASAVVVILVAALVYAPAPPKQLKVEFDPKGYPAGAVEMLREPGFANRIFASDEWGDYLIYRLYPEVKVFVDGRADFYGSKFGNDYLDVLNVKHTWERTLRRYQVDTVVLSVDAALAGALKESRRWRVAYDDGVAIVFKAAPNQLRIPASPAESPRFSAAGAADVSAIARSRTSIQQVIDESSTATRGE